MTIRRLWIAAALPLWAACSHANKNLSAEAPPPAAPPAVAAAPEAPPPPVAAAPAPATCTSDDQCSAKELCLSSRCTPITPELAECHPSPHFDFDRAELKTPDLAKLRRAARCLEALPETTLVEGNCDERGTVQYNIALGFRRAHAVATYLEGLGVPSSSLSEVSYGKELPLCTEQAESCWSMNRRADVSPGAQAKDIAARIRADERHERAKLAKTAPAGKGGAATRAAVQGRHATKQPAPAATDSR